MALSCLCLFAYLGHGNFNQWDGPITLLRCLPEFIAGALLYAGFKDSCWPQWLRLDCAIAAILCALVLLLWLGTPDLLVVIGFPAVILAAVMNAGRAASILNCAPLVWLGNISYSLYLTHGFVQFVTTRLLASEGVPNPADLPDVTSVSLFVAMVGTTLLMAAFTYRGIEIGGRSHLRQLLRPRTERRAVRLQRYSGLSAGPRN